MNKPLSGLLVCRKKMPPAERLSSKFHSCPLSELFIFRTMFQPQALSSDIQAAGRVYFLNILFS